MLRRRGVTMVEVLTVLACGVVAAAIAGSVSLAADGDARLKLGGKRVRVIHQNMVVYAQSNRGFFPGIDGRGDQPQFAGPATEICA